MASSSGFHAPPASTTRPAEYSCPAAVTVTRPADSAMAVTSAWPGSLRRGRGPARCARPWPGGCRGCPIRGRVARCARAEPPLRPAPHDLGPGELLERQVHRAHRGRSGGHVRRAGAACFGDDQPAGAVHEPQSRAPLGDIPALVGSRSQRRVLGSAVGVPDHPGMILRRPAGVPVPVLLERQDAAVQPGSASSAAAPTRRTRSRSPGSAAPFALPNQPAARGGAGSPPGRRPLTVMPISVRYHA